MRQRIGDRSAVAVSVIPVGGDVALRVGDRRDQSRRRVRHRRDVAQRVGDGRQLAERVVGKVVTLAAYYHPARES